MIGLVLVLAYILINVVALALDGARRYGGLKAWWRS